MTKRKTKDEFIQDAINKHGNAYNYNNVNYVNARTLVDIICPQHGLFHLTPHDHLKGQGCKQCGIKRRVGKRKLTLTDFIFKASKIHNNKYNYDLVEYTDYKTSVKIVCPIHGEFTETPQNHLQGYGCKECGKEHKSALFRDTLESFIAKARKVHGDKYDYSLVNYKGSKIDVDIICPIHGIFPQKPNHHLCGSECPKCSYGSSAYENEVIDLIKKSNEEKMKTQGKEEYIKKCNLIHNGKYNYVYVVLKKMKDKIRIICPIHGEFMQRADAHLKGQGCPLCKDRKISKTKSYTLENFITKANVIHQNKYNYDKAKYINSRTPICITCKVHGDFWQLPSNHINKNHPRGCPKCNGGIKLSLNDFIRKSQLIHGLKYDYSKVEYKGSHTKVCIICTEHGEFWQEPRAHIRGQGCPICSIDIAKAKATCTTDEFILKSNRLHGNKYDYSLVDYKGSKINVDIICPKHGEFWQTPSNHLRGEGCPKCTNNSSLSENEIIECLKDIKIEQRNRKILNGKEIDIYIPQYHIGIEFNGLYWHSEERGKDKNYHLRKLNECNKNGIELIQIFEDEWLNKRNICEFLLKAIFRLNISPVICSNKCNVCETVNKEEIDKFLEENDINGKAYFDIAIVAYYNDIMVGIITFEKQENKKWIASRITTNIKYNCIGLEQILFNYFINHYEYETITFLADRRWIINVGNNIYTFLGFKINSYMPPMFKYYNLRNSKIERIKVEEITNESDYTRIWDCGQVKYIYVNNSVE